MARSEQTPIWLDCDTGHDDAFAILLAAHSAQAKLLGISTVFGNASLEKTTYNTRAVLQSIGREDVPVFPGAERPFRREAVHAPEIHGDSGLDGTTCLLPPKVPPQSPGSAVDAMYSALIAEAKGTAWLVATGALTNIAALFREHPDLIEHLAGLSIMGGAVGGGFTDAPMGTLLSTGPRIGNFTAYAEFNLYCDPEAAHAVLSHTALARKTVLVPLDLTHQFIASENVQMQLLFGRDGLVGAEPTVMSASNVRRLFFEIVTFFARTYADMFGFKSGPPVHDPLAVAAAIRPDLFYSNMTGSPEGDHSERFKVSVVTTGEHGASETVRNGGSQCGRILVAAVSPGGLGTQIPRRCDVQTLWAMLDASLRCAEEAISARKAAEAHKHLQGIFVPPTKQTSSTIPSSQTEQMPWTARPAITQSVFNAAYDKSSKFSARPQPR